MFYSLTQRTLIKIGCFLKNNIQFKLSVQKIPCENVNDLNFNNDN